ncbi:MAG: tRNA pseudouridine(38-40) synthase TruA [Alphaproteobacteria bacterium]|nr:tRNA pseudouridine(38-40) synthase TruA [Alphaproteobacteria bacterium]
MTRWKLTIEYDGAPFVGWQRQESDPSVQAAIEKAIHDFCGETVTLHVAGRTDAGVHAVGQVAHADIEKETDAKTVRDAINAHLRPLPVAVVRAEPVSDAFHARFGATRRVYCYKILSRRMPAPAIEQGRVWHVTWDLDIAAMRRAAQYLLGNHDFSSFRAAACQAKSPVRTLERCEVIETTQNLSAGQHIEIWAEARSFLHHQIRNIAGALGMAGMRKWEPEEVKAVLEARDRTKNTAAMAPAHGLYFVRVDY